MNKTLAKLIETGIPVTAAKFHTAVDNSEKVPESYYSAESNLKSRRIEMWYTPNGLVCMHKDAYFIVPLANVIFANFKKNDAESLK